jgi:hypothetical protein
MIILDKKQYYQGLHRSGWSYVMIGIQMMKFDFPLIFDPIVDLETMYHTKPWIGVIHHTFNTDFANNCVELFKKTSFIKSLLNCKGLITLTNYLRDQVVEELYKLKIYNVPVHCLIHPTTFLCPRFTFKTYRSQVVHIGGWLRNPFSIYTLQVLPHIKKYSLRGHHMDHNFPQHESISSHVYRSRLSRPVYYDPPNQHRKLKFNTFSNYMEQYIESCMTSVTIIDHLSDIKYDKLLTESIVFLDLIDCSAVNTVIECAVRNTPIIVNRHPAIEEILGIDYPGYYSNMYEAASLINNVIKIFKCHKFLCDMDKTHLRINTFLSQLSDIIENTDVTPYEIDDYEECCICMESILDDIDFTSCMHSFHKKCLHNWQRCNNTCPICRTTL